MYTVGGDVLSLSRRNIKEPSTKRVSMTNYSAIPARMKSAIVDIYGLDSGLMTILVEPFDPRELLRLREKLF